jgi:hypothetical protein
MGAGGQNLVANKRGYCYTILLQLQTLYRLMEFKKILYKLKKSMNIIQKL